MKAAIRRAARGERARLPYRVTRQIVAARYGQSPSSIDDWPVADFTDALATLELTAPLGTGDDDR